MNTQSFTSLADFLLIVGGFAIIIYYTDLISKVLNKEITKHRFLYCLIPFLSCILIFIESFDQLEK